MNNTLEPTPNPMAFSIRYEITKKDLYKTISKLKDPVVKAKIVDVFISEVKHKMEDFGVIVKSS